MTRTRWIWLVLIAIYAAFFGWYTSFGGPLTDEEIAHYLARMESREPADPAGLAQATLLHEQSEVYWEEWLEKAEVESLTPRRNEIFDDSNVLYQATIDGQGVALICPSLADRELKSGALVCPFDIKLDSYGYYAEAAPDYREHANVKRVLDWLCAQGGCAAAPTPQA